MGARIAVPARNPGIEVEPEPRRLPAELVALGLEDAVAELLHRHAGLVRHHVQHRLPQVRVALAHHLVHACRRHPCVLQQAEGLAGLDRAQLPAVADQRQPRNIGIRRDPRQRLHLHGAHHRGLVEDQHGAAQGPARLFRLLRRGDAVAHVAVAREEPLQGAGRDVGLAREHMDRAGRRGQPDDPALSGQLGHRAQHGGLAGARMALHSHRPVGREQDRARRIALALVQPVRAQARPSTAASGDRPCPASRPARMPATMSRSALRARSVTKARSARLAGRLDQVPVAPQLGDAGIQLFERMPSAPVRQRPGAQVVGREHGAPFLQVLDGAAHHRERRRMLSRLAPGGTPMEPTPLRPAPRVPVPRRADLPGPDLATSQVELAGPAQPCAAACRAPPAVSSPACSPSSGRPCSPEAPGAGSRTRPASAAGSPRSRTPASGPPASAPWRSRWSFEPGPELVAVVGADQELRPLHRGELGAAPVPVPAARHVGDHRVGVKLRVEVAARQMAEGGRRQAVSPAPAGRRPVSGS